MDLVKKLYENVGARWLLAPGLSVLAVLWALNLTAQRRAYEAETGIKAIEAALARSSARTAELKGARDSKSKTSVRIKKALAGAALSKKALYENGLSLQEEKRLLEKQLEIMATYLQIDVQAGKIHLLRGDQINKSFPFPYAPLRVFGNEKRAMPAICRITARERFAFPERAKTEKAGEGLKWEPPQSGERLRYKPLGEFVIFTDGPLVLHAPVAEAALHDAYPHICAGLSREAAKGLYERVFIGNKLLTSGIPAPASPRPSAPKSTPAAKKRK
ncbi:MAG TPA: hypothetical protein DCS63_08165 [Elusimicrobia bacterium]|nr:hypothetical protein [Elusimicrobiota bacterium]